MGAQQLSPSHQAVTAAPSPQLSVIVPTRNEAQNIAPLLERLCAALPDLQAEVLFVDDSTDETVAVIRAIKDNYPVTIRVLARPLEARNGLSGAVVDGLRAARGEWVCVMDADLQHPPETISRLWEQARRTGADIVVGSRRGDLFGPLGLSRLRSLNSKSLTILARMLFPQVLKNVSDPLTGLFLVRRTAVDVDSLQPEGFKILLEILVRSPALYVSEVHFDFAPRHGGESKADVREGGRFLRHLMRLRTSANAHLGRFVALVLLCLLGNSLLFLLLREQALLSDLFSGLLAAEVMWLAAFFGYEYWVFTERSHADLRRRFWGHFLLTQFSLLLVYAPVVLLLEVLGFAWPVAANLLALLAVGLVRYLLSERWIWTRGSMVWQRQSYQYDIHGLLAIESQVPLRDLDYFTSRLEPEQVDVQIRVDRQGTPTHLHGGISYDEHLGRFGFGLTVLPGDYTQIIVSPLLERSPPFLYTNIVEPVLRWRLVQLDHALVKGAAVAKDGEATLLGSTGDMAAVVGELCETFGYGFMADDLTILSRAGRAFSFPKPVTVDRDMLRSTSVSPSLGERLALRGRQLLYTRFVRSIGLWLSEQDLPAASINTYLQRLIPQPKQQWTELYPVVEIVDSARLTAVTYVPTSRSSARDLQAVAQQVAQSISAASFQPHPLLAERLRSWGGVDLIAREQEVICAALARARLRPLDPYAAWWEGLGLDGATNSGAQVEPVQQQSVSNAAEAGSNTGRL